MEKPQPRPVQGMSAGSSAQVTQLARQVSQMSRIEAGSSDSTIAPSGFGAIKEGGPLDPFSDNFDSLAWSKWFYELYQQDTEGNPDRHCGFSAKKLSVHGFGSGAEYQPTVGNMPLSLMGDLISSLQPSRRQKIQILKDFHCLIEPGELLVVLGPPGSGCSTFLKTIAGETNGIYIDEQAELNYHGISNEEMHKVYRGESIYCAEVESNFAALTVGDTLQFAAECRTPEKPPAGINRREFATHVRDVIMALLGISHTINTKVGSDIIRGVSGGERKRVSIAETMLAGSSLQCWDNSTRGLDSATAVQFCKSLRLSADVAGSTASVAIYQSPQSAYEQFDKVTVLYEGQQIYFGPAGDARAFFEEMGFQPMQGQSTPDFLTSLTNPAERQVKKGFEGSVPKTAIEFAQRWKESSTFADLVSQIDKYNNDHPIGGEGSKAFGASRRAQQFKSNRANSPYILSYRQQVSICLRRNWWRIAAQPDQPIFELSGNIILSLLSSSLFYNLSDSSSSFQSRAAVLFLATLLNAFASALEILNMYIQRPIVEKHARYAFYHPSAEAFSSFISSLPYKIVNVTLTSLIWYFMTNLNRTAGHFFFYLFVGFLACVTMSMFFRTVAALSRSLIQAMVPAGIVIVALVVYSGFVIPVRNMRGWSKWMWYIDPIAYAYEALLLNELAGRQFACDSYVPTGPGYPEPGSEQTTCSTVGSEPGNPFVSGDRYLLESYEYVNGHKWRNVGIVIAFILGLFVVYLVASECITEKKSKGEVLVWPRGHNAIARPDDIEANKEIATTNTTKGENANRQEALKQLPRQATFSWSDVCYDVKIKSETRRILDHVDGWVKPGQLTALMGVSGAGKTTLLDLLATRITMGVVAGEKLVDGRPCDRSFQRKTGYVQQQDLHQATATVREALTFSALLRQPASVSKEEKLEYVEEVLRLLEMEAYADAVVGIPGEGLNVEQRKRLTIGVELAAKPDLLLFLDEPTSGLDAQTSWSICSLLEKLSKNGQAILCTIHQPSAQLFERFDRLLFLAKGGRTVYFGEVGSNSKILIDYFVSKGAEECPPQDNPAEWMLKVIGAAPGSHTEIDWHKTWNESEEKKAVKAELADMKAIGGNATADHSQPDDDREFAASTKTQFVEATKRIAQAYWRTPTYFYSKFILVVGTALFIGFSFFKSSEISQREIQNQILSIFILFSIFSQIIEQTTPEYLSIRALYEVRERSSKTYSWWIFLTSHMLIEFGVTILVAIPVFLSWYYPVGFNENADVTGTTHERGILMLLLVIAYLLYAASFGYLTIAAVELADIAGAICNLLFVMMLVFCGVLIPKNSMPGFWKFMYWVVPFTYLGEGMLVTGVDNIPITCSSEELLTIVTPAGQTCAAYLESYISMAGGYIPQNLSAGECQYCPVSNSRDILSNFSMEYGHRWRNLGIMFIYIFANVGATYALYYFFRVPKNKKPTK